MFTTPSSTISNSSSSSSSIIIVNQNDGSNNSNNNILQYDKCDNINAFQDSDNIDASILIKLLKDLPEHDLPGEYNKKKELVKRKCYYKTYQAGSLDAAKLTKSIDFWNELEPDVQRTIRALAVQKTLQHKEQVARDETTVGERSSITTANELLRLLHVLYDNDIVEAIAKITGRSLSSLSSLLLCLFTTYIIIFICILLLSLLLLSLSSLSSLLL